MLAPGTRWLLPCRVVGAAWGPPHQSPALSADLAAHALALGFAPWKSSSRTRLPLRLLQILQRERWRGNSYLLSSLPLSLALAVGAQQ